MPKKLILSLFGLGTILASGGMLLSPVDSAVASPQPATATGNSTTAKAKAAKLPGKAETSSIRGEIIHAQVLLDVAGFSPGVIDGLEGKNLAKALRGYQEAKGLEVTGKLDTPTRQSLLTDPRKHYRKLRIDRSIVDGEFVRPFPDDPAEQADLDALNYRNLLEEVAERFHTTYDVIIALNGPKAKIGIGRELYLPNVLPSSRDFGDDWAGAEYNDWFNAMNVSADLPQGDRIIVDESEGTLRVFDAEDRLIAQFPVTTGSENDPLPLGDWKATTYAFMPPFSYQPKLFWDVPDSEEEQKLPPGPNGPVGIAWLDLTKEHYGIHGTPEPSTIGYAQSHGCIRMTNWDVLKLARMMKPGFEAEFVA
ncbi:L,D-transpeptidase family protein [Sphingomicrobium lutaoense]|uniref:Lipoprotein-anchoring transpeptidase ErfK/SrfK n=1 Tax=Sphingomicrobium lutaoense TaxID=515949 RepID=A0A839YXI3_9SPHN|nr:L,D-transpeptidase family protein [Sphingomicrobium lutaoense]MBB3763889.1 lipoprotein-anchoring transpeptidase ErfK/SrfK [Sphingomicrobium lutaoense]